MQIWGWLRNRLNKMVHKIMKLNNQEIINKNKREMRQFNIER